MEPIRVLIIDDEVRMRNLLSLYLEPNGYVCEKAATAREAISMLQTKEYDLILLDIMMPDIDGYSLCEIIRKDYDIPIIMITARSSKDDMVKGLEMGSDDYITKPFDETVLLARIGAVLRRHRRATDSQNLNHDAQKPDLEVLVEAFEIRYLSKLIPLTPKEFELITMLMKHPKRVFKREELMSLIWGYDSETEDRTIDSHIRNIRDKFRKVNFPIDDHLKTVWGIGYRWNREV